MQKYGSIYKKKKNEANENNQKLLAKINRPKEKKYLTYVFRLLKLKKEKKKITFKNLYFDKVLDVIVICNVSIMYTSHICKVHRHM